MKKDFYKILGVSETASGDEIKQAFRSLAKKYHPDVAPTQTERFKEISEAYETLSDKDSRTKYDRKNNASGFRGNGASSKNYEDFFSRSGGFADIFGRNKYDYDDILGAFRENLRKQSGEYGKPQTEISIPITMAYVGGNVQVEGIDFEPIPVYIRPRTLPNTKLNVASKRGSVEVTVKVVDDTDFRLSGNNIITTIQVPLNVAILGGEIFIKDPAKDRYVIKIPAGTQAGTVFRLKGQGLGNNDLLATIDIKIPKCDNNEALENFKRDVNSYTISK